MDDFTQLAQGRTKGETGLESKEIQALRIKSIDADKRQITAIASTETLDRDNEIIELAAFKRATPAYMKNAVVLAYHQHRLADGRSPVVGFCVKAWVDKKAFYITVQFADTTLGLEYWKLYSEKIQKAFSVGFKVIASDFKTIEGRRVNVITEIDLFEISCVPVGANPDALSKAAQKKRDFVEGKKQERQAFLGFTTDMGLSDTGQQLTDEQILEKIHQMDPDFDQKCTEYAEALLDYKEIDGEIADPGEAPDDIEFAALVRSNKQI